MNRMMLVLLGVVVGICGVADAAQLHFRHQEGNKTKSLYFKPTRDGNFYRYSNALSAEYNEEMDLFTVTCVGTETLLELNTGSKMKVVLQGNLTVSEKVDGNDSLEIVGPGILKSASIYSDGMLTIRNAVIHGGRIHTYMDPILIENSDVIASSTKSLIQGYSIRIVSSMLSLNLQESSADAAIETIRML